MVKHHLFFIIFLVNITIGLSQDVELDSIKNWVETHDERDSFRVLNLLQLTKYYSVRDNTKNLELIDEAFSISKELNFAEGIGIASSTYSTYYRREGDYIKALDYAFKAKSIQDSIHDVKGLVVSNTNIAQIYGDLSEFDKAIKILKQNIEILQYNDPLIAGIHFYLAKLYTETKDYKASEKQYLAARKIAINTNFKTGVAIANSSLGTLAIRQKEYQKGIGYLLSSLEFYEENNQTLNIGYSCIEIAEAYFELSKIKKSITYNNKAILIFEAQSSLKYLGEVYLNQSKYYNAKQDFKNEVYFLKEHYSIRDSIFSIDNMEIIGDMKTKYETEKIQHEKEVAEKQASISKLESIKNRNLFIGSITIASFMLLSALFYFGQYRAKQKSNLILSELKETQKRLGIEKQYRDSELKALKSQMNPHFIFNALNSIQEFILFNQKELASDYLGKFADLIRNYLHYSDTGLISIQEEVNNLNLYMELEKLRFEENLNYEIVVDEDVNADIWYLPTMIIQPYVENALKHGLLHIKTNRKLTISMSKLSDDLIECQVIDNGIGRAKSKIINEKTKSTHRSFALKATTKRLELLNFGKDKKIGVAFIDLLDDNEEPNGTKVILKIPITKKY